MSQIVSPSSKRSYGLARVSRVWEMSRSTIYAQKHRALHPLTEDRRGRPRIDEEALLRGAPPVFLDTEEEKIG